MENRELKKTYNVPATDINEGVNVHTAELGLDLKSMRFTVKPNAAFNTFTLPFNSTTGKYTLTVDWGDGSEATIIPAGTLTTDSKLSHTYNIATEYIITLRSDVSADGEQMPRWNFYSKPSSRLLISMDTPMLNMNTINLSSCFDNCNYLTGIPEGLFSANTAAAIFLNCFQKCYSLTEIPAGLFSANTAANNFTNCFYGCTGLTEIPARLFSANTAVTTFSSCFSSCTNLKRIPAGLFSTNTAVTTFSSCFIGCKNLTGIPEELFSANTAVTDFANCFVNCTSLRELPPGLFAANTAVTCFGSCFVYCTSLKEIPARLFSANTAVTNFTNCFYGCNSLQYIPARLFTSNTAATNFAGCFSGCRNAILNSNIFCDEDSQKDTRFQGKAMNFESCFSYTGSSIEGNPGIAPALWTYGKMKSVTSTNCFTNCPAADFDGVTYTGWK